MRVYGDSLRMREKRILRKYNQQKLKRRNSNKDTKGCFYNRYLWLLFSIRSLKIVDLWLRRVEWTTGNN